MVKLLLMMMKVPNQHKLCDVNDCMAPSTRDPYFTGVGHIHRQAGRRTRVLALRVTRVHKGKIQADKPTLGLDLSSRVI